MPSKLAAVTCYFNPCHFRSRHDNYLVFEKRLARSEVPLVTVELAFGDDPWELPPAENRVQLRTQDVMWQKERLLNLGIERLGAEYNLVAWLDCDVLFPDDDWGERTVAALQRVALVQCFRDVVHLPKGTTVPAPVGPRKFGTRFLIDRTGLAGNGYSGYAWAARRELLQAWPLYDVQILGGADLLMALATFDQANLIAWTKTLAARQIFERLNRPALEHYYDWASGFGKALGGSVGYVNQTVCALFHGALTHRFYAERMELLADFDPCRDLALDAGGCWRWNSDKHELHQEVRDYFLARKEDE